jgi:hypothetical protein
VSRKSLLALALTVAAIGCASGSTPSSGASDVAATPSRSTSRNRDLISQEDLNADPTLRAQTVIDVIRSIRPQYLVNRGNNTMKDSASKANTDIDAGKVHASVDGGRIVEVTDLTMTAAEILEIRYLNVAQANLKFGTAARQGPVILVTTRKQ